MDTLCSEFVTYVSQICLSPNAYWGFSGGSNSKESACNAGDPGSIPGLERSPEKDMATHSSILAGEFQGQRSLVDYSPWGHKESGTTEQLTHTPKAIR